MDADLGPLLKAAYPRLVASLTRILGNMDRAQDAAQDAVVRALEVWHREGVPNNPTAWLVTVARNRAVDGLRREQRVVALDDKVVPIAVTSPLDAGNIDRSTIDDDLLRLMFTCCHPSLQPGAQTVLMLKVVLGMSVNEIAAGLLSSPASIEKRITRAKALLRHAKIAYEVPARDQLPARIDVILQAIYLIYNEGYTRIQDTQLIRSSLIDVALRLGRMVARMFRANADARSLLALMLLNTARLSARLDEAGRFVPLHAQDRTRWDPTMIAEGLALIDAVYIARHPPSSYQIQAAISALHCKAASADQTDWPQIAALYEKLEEYDRSPAVSVNRAVALCCAGRESAALAALQALGAEKTLKSYQPYHAALGFVYTRLGANAEAVTALQQAKTLAPSLVQQRYIEEQIVHLVN